MTIRNLIKDSYLLRRAYVSDDLEQALDNLAANSETSFKDYRFKSGTSYNGWVVPQKWTVHKAEIRSKGKLIYDGMAHPLGVITNSSTFSGTISREELLPHLHSSPQHPKAIPFHFRLSYRPWESEWGFCIPKTLVDSLKSGDYQVELKTTLEPGEMVTREFMIPGRSSETIIFVAHIDHPGMANDDLAGCAVGVALFNEIRKAFPKPYYTYKLILTQEIMGSVFYLRALKAKVKKIKFGLFLEMLGNDNHLNLQTSFTGDSYIDQLCTLALSSLKTNYKTSGFRESAGNDEITFEAPGIEIPMPSLSRWPYPEYHTSDDNMDIIHEDKLQESLHCLLKVVNYFEKDGYIKRTFDGLISLANPQFDLYIDPGQIITTGLHSNQNAALFQYKMPRYLTGEYRVSDIARLFNLDFDWVLDYYQKMQSKKLVTITRKKGK